MIRRREGFTLIELVITITTLTVLATIAIPAWQNIQLSTRKNSLRASAVAVRAAIAVYRGNELASGRASGASGGGWPTFGHVQDTRFGDDVSPPVMERGDVPNNAFAGVKGGGEHVTANYKDCVADASIWGATKGDVWIAETTICDNSTGPAGWWYNPTNGDFWANTQTQGAAFNPNCECMW